MSPTPVNILLVDDESRNLDVLESLLYSPEYNLVRALTAERALMLLLDGEFAVIVLDIQMPGMSGIELASLIKQRRRTQHIPIIFLTAYFQEDKDVLEGYGSGAVDYLTKPINPQILRSKIAVFVDLFRKTRALAATNAALEQEVEQRQKAEESLRLANSELETRVQERTADLQRANRELLQRGEQLRLVTDHAPVFIAQIDRQHRFKFVNRTYARRFGFEPKDVIGRHFTDIMGDGPYRAIRHHLEAALAGERVEFEAEIAYASLGPRWVYVIHEPERGPDGEVIGLVAVVTDITERKQAEQAVAAARDEALAASRAKDDFLARLSHELRTPLNPVLLLASEAAANLALAPDVRADFETIAQNVMLEARLIDDLLDLTRITRGKLSLNLALQDVRAIVQDALATMRGDLEQKRLVLTCDLGEQEAKVRGDAVRLQQVLWNVLKNAVKFTPDGGTIAVRIDLSPETESAAIEIRDTGIGMTPAEIARAFDAFSQGDHATGRDPHRFGGVGLGLTISRMLMELHRGRIEARSEGRDHGSTFRIELPLAGRDERKVEALLAARDPSRPPFAMTNGAGRPAPRLLLVEDHEPTRVALEQLLKRRNYDVVVAGSVAEARAAAADATFDLVLSDVGLPDGNGYDLMAELRKKRSVVGIALTGYGMDHDIARSQVAGFAVHLTKPVTVQSLDRALAAAGAARTNSR